jgi:amidase
MAGLTVAPGSPAFQNMTAEEEAFTVGRLRSHCGILLGKTNMPRMANGGVQHGIYGQAKNPYNKACLIAAFSVVSSNGTGSSIPASFVLFSMAEETVSSSRSPASNHGLVADTPSRGVLSIHGNWPLFSDADVVVRYARTVGDLLQVLDVIVADDES